MVEFVLVWLAMAALVVGLCVHPRTRPYAHLPVAVLSIGVSALVGSHMGAFVRAASLAPGGVRCGTPLAVATVALFIIWSAVGTVGAALLVHPATQRSARLLLLSVLPWSLAAAVVGGVVARLWW